MKCTPAETFSCINSEICKTGLFINKTIKSSFISFTIEKTAYMKIKLSICKTLFSVSFYSIYSMERLIKHKVLRIFTCVWWFLIFNSNLSYFHHFRTFRSIYPIRTRFRFPLKYFPLFSYKQFRLRSTWTVF